MSGYSTPMALHAGTRSATIADHVLCGWRVRSELPLPEVMIWAGDDRPPDVIVRLGATPPLNDAASQGRGPVEVGRDGRCRLDIKDVGSFLAIAGREVVVEPRVSLDSPDLRNWLLGVVLGMLCHQRGLFPLHASCVRIGGAAVAFAGRTGAGKSTLAAALASRGHGLIADDVCAVELVSDGPPQVRPSFPRLRLWDDAMSALDFPAEGAPRGIMGKQKFHYCQPGRFDPSPARLSGVYFLERIVDDRQPVIRRLNGLHAAATLSNEIYRRWIGFRLGRESELLAEALRIVSGVPIFHCPIRSDLTQIEAEAARVDAHVSSLCAGAGAAL
jgi:HPr Serine kinase C-terminal domain